MLLDDLSQNQIYGYIRLFFEGTPAVLFDVSIPRDFRVEKTYRIGGIQAGRRTSLTQPLGPKNVTPHLCVA